MHSEMPVQPTLTRREWQTVSIALADAAACGCAGEPGPLGRFVAALTGSRSLRPLADRRLEAIRGFVCETRRTRRPAVRFAPVLESEGFSRPQIDALALLAA